MATAMRAFVVVACAMIFLVLAELECADTPQEVEAEETAGLDGASVQLLQLATSLQQSSAQAAESHPELGVGGRKHEHQGLMDADVHKSLQQLRELLPARKKESQPKVPADRTGVLLPARKTESQPKVPAGRTDIDKDIEHGEDRHPPVNGTEMLEKLRKHLSGQSLLEVGDMPGCSGRGSPLQYNYSDGTSSFNNFCGAGHRYALWDGKDVPWDICALGSCHPSLYKQYCTGGLFFTRASAGIKKTGPNAEAKCACCTAGAPVYKSSVGNRVYDCGSV